MKKLWFLWLTIAIIELIAAYFLLFNSSSIPFPSTQEMAHLAITSNHKSFDFKKENNDFIYQNRPLPRLKELLALIPNACDTPYPTAAIQINHQNDPLTLSFVINRKDRWQFTSHNPAVQKHFLVHGDTTYLCDERVKVQWQNFLDQLDE